MKKKKSFSKYLFIKIEVSRFIANYYIDWSFIPKNGNLSHPSNLLLLYPEMHKKNINQEINYTISSVMKENFRKKCDIFFKECISTHFMPFKSLFNSERFFLLKAISSVMKENFRKNCDLFLRKKKMFL